MKKSYILGLLLLTSIDSSHASTVRTSTRVQRAYSHIVDVASKKTTIGVASVATLGLGVWLTRGYMQQVGSAIKKRATQLKQRLQPKKEHILGGAALSYTAFMILRYTGKISQWNEALATWGQLDSSVVVPESEIDAQNERFLDWLSNRV